jgi:hypothetical protein
VLVAHSTEGWDWVVPVVRRNLDRMADLCDAPLADRLRWADSLTKLIVGDQSFSQSPLAAELFRVVAAFKSGP